MAGASRFNHRARVQMNPAGQSFPDGQEFQAVFTIRIENVSIRWFGTKRVLFCITYSYCLRCDQVEERTGPCGVVPSEAQDGF